MYFDIKLFHFEEICGRICVCCHVASGFSSAKAAQPGCSKDMVPKGREGGTLQIARGTDQPVHTCSKVGL